MHEEGPSVDGLVSNLNRQDRPVVRACTFPQLGMLASAKSLPPYQKEK